VSNTKTIGGCGIPKCTGCYKAGGIYAYPIALETKSRLSTEPESIAFWREVDSIRKEWSTMTVSHVYYPIRYGRI
jgi:hypothetical protein